MAYKNPMFLHRIFFELKNAWFGLYSHQFYIYGFTLFKNIALQSVIFIGLFLFLSWLKTLDMLSTSSNIEASDITYSALTLETVNGKEISLINNGKKSVLYFFAPWCQICHVSIGNLQDLADKNPHLNIVAIGLDYVDKEEVERFTRQHKLSIPIAYGNEHTKNLFKISGYPSYYVISESNTVLAKSIGYSTELGLYLRSLL